MSFTNWVVEVRSKVSKKHVKSMGKATEEEAEKLRNEWNLELIRDGKDRWYEVVVTPPESDVERAKIIERLREKIVQTKQEVKELKG